MKKNVILAAASVVIGGAALFFAFRREPHPDNRIFYSVDDGKTWFADQARPVPFNHQGKQAVRCYVFQAGGKQFAKYLLTYSPAVHDAMAARTPVTEDDLLAGTLVKKPGDKDWVPSRDSGARAITKPLPSETMVEP